MNICKRVDQKNEMGSQSSCIAKEVFISTGGAPKVQTMEKNPINVFMLSDDQQTDQTPADGTHGPISRQKHEPGENY